MPKSRFLGVAGLAALTLASATHPASAEQYKVVTAVADKMAPGNTAFVDTLKGPRLVEIDRGGTVVWQCSLAKAPMKGGEINKGADVEWIPSDDTFLVVVPLHGIFRLDRTCSVTWKHLTRKVSHDADLLANGNVLHTFGWDGRGDPQAVELDPAGKVVWSWQAKGKVDESWRRTPGKGEESRPSYAHANAVVRLPNGDTLVSLRNFHRVARVAPDGSVSKFWGPIPAVHEPNLMPDGTLIASDHRHSTIVAVGGGQRRVVYDNPSRIEPMRTVQPLPNGNFLLTGGEDILEIDAAGATVWHVKVYSGLRKRIGNGVYKAARVAK